MEKSKELLPDIALIDKLGRVLVSRKPSTKDSFISNIVEPSSSNAHSLKIVFSTLMKMGNVRNTTSVLSHIEVGLRRVKSFLESSDLGGLA